MKSAGYLKSGSLSFLMTKMQIQRVLNEKIIANMKCYSAKKMPGKLLFTQKADCKHVSNY